MFFSVYTDSVRTFTARLTMLVKCLSEMFVISAADSLHVQ